jgi:signal transduction histidine kinase
VHTPPDYLVATLLALPDERRAEVERELTAAARDAVLGRLAADIAHDFANPVFAIVGLTDLLLADPGSKLEERLSMIRQTGLGLKADLQDLLELARAEPGGAPQADLVDAARTAVRLVRHGRGKLVDVDERYPDAPVDVACPKPLAVQAALHLLSGARETGFLQVEVTREGVLRVAPALLGPLDAVAARRIAADHGGTLAGGSLALPPPEL